MATHAERCDAVLYLVHAARTIERRYSGEALDALLVIDDCLQAIAADERRAQLDRALAFLERGKR